MYLPSLKTARDIQQKDYVFKFLMGMNESFDNIRGQIIIMSPLPSLDKTYSLVLQEERQRLACSVVLPNLDISALAACQNSSNKRDKLDFTYTHYGKSRHTREKCFRLIGFPQNFKFAESKLNPTVSNTGGSPFAHQVNVSR